LLTTLGVSSLRFVNIGKKTVADVRLQTHHDQKSNDGKANEPDPHDDAPGEP
jgi:hypothetical protein